MANTNETVADIIAEMLGARTEFPFVYLIGEPDTPEVIDFSTTAIIAPRKINIRRVAVNELADRLKAAHKRERGDCAKMREALLRCDAIAQLPEVRNEQSIKDMRNIIKRALAEPARNCDVGTADDWVARFSVVCERCSGSDCDHRLFKDDEICDCFARWLQMTYEEGGEK